VPRADTGDITQAPAAADGYAAPSPVIGLLHISNQSAQYLSQYVRIFVHKTINMYWITLHQPSQRKQPFTKYKLK